ncbi:MAG: putative ABC exporter domain-containing protein [Fimbriimonadaceae bacterium]
MRALWFLSFRSFVNAVNRALGSPRRILGLLFFLAYLGFFLVRPWIVARPSEPTPPAPDGPIELPALELIENFVFVGFAGLTVLLIVNAVTQRLTFKQADVDVLFPTPISPKVVLLFRMLRDYIWTLLLPLFAVLLTLGQARAESNALFPGFPRPEGLGLMIRFGFVSWLLMSLGWVTLTYALSLSVSRSDLTADRNRRILIWTMVTAFAAGAAWLVFRLQQVEVSVLVTEIARSWVARTVFFTASFSTMLTMAPAFGSVWAGLFGLVGLVGTIGAGFGLAVRQSDWMYDQAAVRGHASSTIRDLQQRGDTMGVLAEMARQGKLKPGRERWIHRVRVQGALSLLWKEALLQTRGLWGLWLALLLFATFLSVLPALVPTDRIDRGVVAMFYFLQAAAAFMTVTSVGQMGYIEMLRRVDLQKPLPFRPATIVFYEVLSKSLLSLVACWLGCTAAIVVKPLLWPHALAAMVAVPPFAVLLSAALCLITVMFPDVDDPGQRQFRGFVTLIALGLLAVPSVGAFAGLMIAGLFPVAVAVLSGALSLALALGVAALAGQLYAGYNPSE